MANKPEKSDCIGKNTPRHYKAGDTLPAAMEEMIQLVERVRQSPVNKDDCFVDPTAGESARIYDIHIVFHTCTHKCTVHTLTTERDRHRGGWSLVGSEDELQSCVHVRCTNEIVQFTYQAGASEEQPTRVEMARKILASATLLAPGIMRDVQLFHGDCLDAMFNKLWQRATVIFLNNAEQCLAMTGGRSGLGLQTEICDRIIQHTPEDCVVLCLDTLPGLAG
jgi:hypothetical protein